MFGLATSIANPRPNPAPPEAKNKPPKSPPKEPPVPEAPPGGGARVSLRPLRGGGGPRGKIDDSAQAWQGPQPSGAF